ncbi:MAG: Fic family protein [Saprospiraceae bacterium]|nr:Fic family protein [Saprospiraceae bacterium]
MPASERGKLRTNPMFVINEADRIEYIAAEPHLVNKEWLRLLNDIDLLLAKELTINEVFYYAAMIHLVFVKIHPFQDGNGRTARLLEKWFLLEKLGEKAVAVELEKNYYVNRADYYANIRKLGLTYEELDYGKALDFTLMTISILQ